MRVSLFAGTIAVVVTLAGLGYYRNERAELRGASWRELGAVADLKVRQVTEWRTERMNDARFLRRTPAVGEAVAAVLAQPNSAAARTALSELLEPIKGGDRYESIIVVDRQGGVCLAIPADTNPPGRILTTAVQAVLAGGEVVMTDLHRRTPLAPAHLEVIAPIFAPVRDRGNAAREPIAAIVLRIDPAQYLFPLIDTWPTPSATASSLLVRREAADRVVFHDVRQRSEISVAGAAAPFALPQDIRRVTPGVREGPDHRGVPVLAEARPVADSGWVLVAKIDQAEAYAPIRYTAWKVAGTVVVVLLAVAGVVAYLWRMRNEQALRRTLQAERKARVLAERVAMLMRHANDIVLLADHDLRILEANDRALAAYGYAQDELQRRRVPDLRPPRGAATPDEAMEHRPVDGAVFETVHQRKDGRTFPVEVSCRLVSLDDRKYLLEIVRDITERKRAEQEIVRTSRALRTISRCNQTLVRAQNESDLLEAICLLVVEHGGYRMAWVGYVEQDAGLSVRPVAQVRSEPEHPEFGPFAWGEEARGSNPAETCARTGTVVVCRDTQHDPAFAPWQADAARRGYASLIALPLRSVAGPLGALVIFSGEVDGFDPSQVALLGELADDLAYGIANLRGQMERRRTEASRRESEARFARLFELSVDAILESEPGGHLLAANPAACALFGRTEEELRRCHRNELFDPADPRTEALWEERDRRGCVKAEVTLRRGDGASLEAEVSTTLYTDAAGRRRCSMIIRDVTGRKQGEQALAAQLVELQRWHAVTLGREQRILELKTEINRLLVAAGQPARYAGVDPAAPSS
ncbi:PAS domain S-box protein [Opitutus sp. ER46]|uniref:PAS domain S-box protein n=1 Tax=Opitutus sp. ER46 TaxID=2161864 RepID=UPI000D31B5E5|nr:PAS domain S-box protein [Opitutus sp. ER46]